LDFGGNFDPIKADFADEMGRFSAKKFNEEWIKINPKDDTKLILYTV